MTEPVTGSSTLIMQCQLGDGTRLCKYLNSLLLKISLKYFSYRETLSDGSIFIVCVGTLLYLRTTF